MQYYLLMTSLICVPWMLIFKPLILWMRMPAHKPAAPVHNDLDENLVSEEGENEDVAPRLSESSKSETGSGSAHEEHDISEIAVNKIIETI